MYTQKCNELGVQLMPQAFEAFRIFKEIIMKALKN